MKDECRERGVGMNRDKCYWCHYLKGRNRNGWRRVTGMAIDFVMLDCCEICNCDMFDCEVFIDGTFGFQILH